MFNGASAKPLNYKPAGKAEACLPPFKEKPGEKLLAQSINRQGWFSEPTEQYARGCIVDWWTAHGMIQ